jgi:Xaa-Pro aminopeptidase
MVSSAQKLQALREVMLARDLDALIVARSDEYLGEYLPAHNERLAWCSGFSGSAGFAVIAREEAAIFVDGRYTVQVRGEVDSTLFAYRELSADAASDYLCSVLAPGQRAGCDARAHTLRWYERTAAQLAKAEIELVGLAHNLVDEVWRDRPAEQRLPAQLLAERFTGESSAAKRARIGAAVAAEQADAALIFAPDSVSWLLNIRGTDIPMLPVLQSFAVLESDGTVVLVAAAERIPNGFSDHVGEGVSVVSPDQVAGVFRRFADRRVLADPDTASAWVQQQLRAAGAQLIPAPDPVLLPKASKNTVELAGARAAQLRDGAAVVRFLCWLDAQVSAGRYANEAALAQHLDALRAAGEHYQDKSFDTISAAGANAALCHYNYQQSQPAELQPDSVYLVDSGGQYLDGTTDITRTVAIGDPGAELRRLFTLVLKGHIALARARFPAGTTGTHLDVLARQYLWQAGCDFDHGTGHGVGAYLSVHEGPQRISRVWHDVALQPGMIVSNEPGYYREGAFGIRCENLIAVVACDADDHERPMLAFETLTLAPFDRRLMDLSLLDAEELRWLNVYHQRVAAKLLPQLSAPEQDWLRAATVPLEGPEAAPA